MRYILDNDIDVQVRRLTRGQYGITFTDDYAEFLNLTTGENVKLGHAVPYGPPAMDVPEKGEKLSGREREVLTLMGDAVGSSEIAERLGLSIKTVETYRARLKQKLDITDSLKLMRYAVEWNLRHGCRSMNGESSPTNSI
jgi:DNA-binding NarL/FixJ family response regulator